MPTEHLHSAECLQTETVSVQLCWCHLKGAEPLAEFKPDINSLHQIDVVGLSLCAMIVKGEWLFPGASVYICEMPHALLSIVLLRGKSVKLRAVDSKPGITLSSCLRQASVGPAKHRFPL